MAKMYRLCQGDSRFLNKKVFTSPIGDMSRFSGKKENHSISVIKNFSSRSTVNRLLYTEGVRLLMHMLG